MAEGPGRRSKPAPAGEAKVRTEGPAAPLLSPRPRRLGRRSNPPKSPLSGRPDRRSNAARVMESDRKKAFHIMRNIFNGPYVLPCQPMVEYNSGRDQLGTTLTKETINERKD